MPIEKDWNKHVDRLLEIIHSIEPKKLTILTGSNASGKSVIRKQITHYMAEKLGIFGKPCVASISFMSRAGLDSFRGINFLRDSDWAATSQNSIRLAKSLLNNKDRYLVLDEPEIGMSEEMQLALALYINSIKDECLSKNYGIMVITHSRVIVDELNEDAFVCIDEKYKTKREWINREIIPTDLEQYEKDASALFEAIRERSKPKSEE